LGDVYEGKLQNNYLYQGAYSELDEDIGWTDFALRNYDAQIGRWVQQDPYDQFASPYIGIGDDPINNIDPSGGITYCPGTSALAIFLDKAIYALSKTSPALFKLSIAISITKTAFFIENTIRTSNMINGQLATMQAGGGDGGKDPLELNRKISAISMGELAFGDGFTTSDLVMMGTAYQNRVARYGADHKYGLKGSAWYTAALKNPNSTEGLYFRMFMRALGSKDYQDDDLAKQWMDKNPTYTKTVTDIYNSLTITDFFEKLLDKNLALPAGIFGQGYSGDINGLHGNKNYYNKQVRQYIYLIYMKVIPNSGTLVVLRPNKNLWNTTFLYNEDFIKLFFKKFPKLKAKKSAPLYDYKTDSFKTN
jgi:RHS repeat-associated protein